MHDFLVALAFVAMVASPAFVGLLQSKQEGDPPFAPRKDKAPSRASYIHHI